MLFSRLYDIVSNCETMFSKAPLYKIDNHRRARFRCVVARNGAYDAKIRRLNTGGDIAPCLRFVYFAQLLSWNHAFRNYLIYDIVV